MVHVVYRGGMVDLVNIVNVVELYIYIKLFYLCASQCLPSTSNPQYI